MQRVQPMQRGSSIRATPARFTQRPCCAAAIVRTHSASQDGPR
jgi:hypothetical protein